MSEISCGGCGVPLSHINAVCDDCLPNFYSTGTDAQEPYPTVFEAARNLATDASTYPAWIYCNLLKDCVDDMARKDEEIGRLRGKATDLDALIDLASKAVLKVLEHDGGDFELDKGPHGGWLIKHDGYFNLSVTMRAAVVDVVSEMASHA